MPREVLRGRVARFQQAMREQQLEAVLAYTSFARPAVVHWLTNFTPYWSEAMLVVPATGEPMLLASLTPRVHDWIRSMAHLGEVVSAPRLGEAALAHLQERLKVRVGAKASVGVVGLPWLPASVAEPLAGSGLVLSDFGETYRALRQPVDAYELRLARRALAITTRALAAVPAGVDNTAALAQALERSARLEGAEEVLLRVAPDLSQGSALLRLERPMPLARTYAVEVALAYKGAWIRLGHSFSRDAEPAAWRQHEAAFDDAVARLRPGPADHSPDPGCVQEEDEHWTVQASVDANPLAAVGQGHRLSGVSLPEGALAMLSCHARASAGAWFRSLPVVLQPQGAMALGMDA